MFTGCKSPGNSNVSFYYWKTVFELSDHERETLEHNHVTNLYVRYFDVVIRQGKSVPVSAVTFKDSVRNINIVPVIYIKNEVMLQPLVNIDSLALDIVTYINKINTTASIRNSEIQLDCDWTISSKETFFKFVEKIKAISGKTLSATIRLHQIKYLDRTGIPPVDKGVLMYYNMGHIAADASNSIYEREASKNYLVNLESYPLPLDVALPVFSWGIHIRNNKVIGLVNKTDDAVFLNDNHFKRVEAPFFEVNDDVMKAGRYFQQGDRIKIESISQEDLEDMADDISAKMAHKPIEIIFYDFDDFNLNHYPDENLFQKISTAF